MLLQHYKILQYYNNNITYNYHITTIILYTCVRTHSTSNLFGTCNRKCGRQSLQWGRKGERERGREGGREGGRERGREGRKEGRRGEERGGRNANVIVHPLCVGFDAADKVRRRHVHLLDQHLQGVLVEEGGREKGGTMKGMEE